MDITLEQAKALEAISRLGTVQKAAQELNKGHSGVLYLIKGLEEQTKVSLFDRSGYRNTLTPKGQVVLKYCQQLLQTRNSLVDVCKKMHQGWEPSLKLIYDGVIDFNMIADALYTLRDQEAPTEINVRSGYLDEVADLFEKEQADLMLTILPLKQKDAVSFKLRPLKMLLVSAPQHKLSTLKTVSTQNLLLHTCIKIQGASHHIGLSTESLKTNSSFLVNDFVTKKAALLKGLGYGWMPEYLIKKELQEKKLIRINTEIESSHYLQPRLFHKPTPSLGKMRQLLVEHFKKKI